MKRLLLLFLTGFYLAAADKPNIIIMYVDDLDFDQLSVYDPNKFPCYTGAKETGNLKELNESTAYQNGRFLKLGEKKYHKDPKVLTPNMERLAAEGTVFNRFYVTSSTCTPSRYSLLTGRYASRALSDTEKSSVPSPPIVWNTYLSQHEGHIAKDLKLVGYTTALVGKWHLGDKGINLIDTAKGYKNYLVNGGPKNSAVKHRYKGDYFPMTSDPYDPKIQKEISRIYQDTQTKIKELSGFDVVDRLYYTNYDLLPIPESMKVHNLEWQTEGALNFIEANKQKPFFLYFSITAPHGQYFEDWMTKDWRATPAGMLKEKPKSMPSRHSVLNRINAAGIPHQNAMATWIDDSLGAVMKKLETLNLSENTVIMFLSDHQARGKLAAYEGHRAPAIIKLPKGYAGKNIEDEIIANIDIRSTINELAGLSSPNDKVDGHSILPLIQNKSINWRKNLLLETGYSRAIVSKDWKYIANRPPSDVVKLMQQDKLNALKKGTRRHIGWTGRRMNSASGMGVRFDADQDFPHYFDADQLYNLKHDVFEQHNLIYKEQNLQQSEIMKKRLKEHLKRLPFTFGEFK